MLASLCWTISKLELQFFPFCKKFLQIFYIILVITNSLHTSLPLSSTQNIFYIDSFHRITITLALPYCLLTWPLWSNIKILLHNHTQQNGLKQYDFIIEIFPSWSSTPTVCHQRSQLSSMSGTLPSKLSVNNLVCWGVCVFVLTSIVWDCNYG